MDKEPRYLTSNLWESFKRDFPVLKHIPFVRVWAFGAYARGYFRVKQPHNG